MYNCYINYNIKFLLSKYVNLIENTMVNLLDKIVIEIYIIIVGILVSRMSRVTVQTT